MFTLQIEHDVRDFRMWKRAFDGDPLDRAGSGVRSYRISRPIGEENHVMVELDFETQEAAVFFLARLENDVWKSGAAAQALLNEPSTRIIETLAVETLEAP
ncbi:hypothetical protein [Arthrobacter mobilis]|uniref:Antibiotic biosynthesis monooxygenase n=1 Tax=Arthrobacter mobilis TaxID=2724944 RepID=A0A7X6HEJ9_9MICC|nr:hypothetical protein [Arthrobacter mobilis]NKX55561.1 hypothetical protein [Arthrobacter mobilis]